MLKRSKSRGRKTTTHLFRDRLPIIEEYNRSIFIKIRRRPDSNRCMKVLQTSPLPLGYGAAFLYGAKITKLVYFVQWQVQVFGFHNPVA